jgi:hypothetical protein
LDFNKRILKKRRIPKITGRSDFAKDRMIASKCCLGRNIGSNEAEVTRFVVNVHAVFEKAELPPKRISNTDESVPSKLPKMICKKTEDSWATLYAHIAND